MTYTCPYCKVLCRDDGKITKSCYESHEASGVNQVIVSDDQTVPDVVVLELSKCPNCGKTSVSLKSHYRSTGFHFSFSFPPPNAENFPEYVPSAICDDYIEAISIVDTSPKASATLARRCLQGMIHDFWGIKEKNLNAEITALKGRVPAAQWNAIDALRKIGNIGAHMEKDINVIVDVDPDEAKALIKLIELLIDKWYIARHDEEMLLADIVSIGVRKESERKSGGVTSISE